MDARLNGAVKCRYGGHAHVMSRVVAVKAYRAEARI